MATRGLLLLCIIALCLCWTAESKQCRDTDKRCRQWGATGNCFKDQNLRKKCPDTCGLCRTPDEDDILRSVHASTEKTIFLMYLFAGFIVSAFIVAVIRLTNTGGVCLSKGNMKDKLVVITGGTSGVGLDTAFHLALRGAKVVIGCRNLKKGFKAVKDLRSQTGQKLIEVRKLDLASLASIKEFADVIKEEFPKIDVLINSAGVYGSRKRDVTEDGMEKTFQVNYLGHFYLTKLLSQNMKETAPSRIINVVSDEFKKGNLDFKNLQGLKNYNNAAAYRNANLAIMYFTKELAKVLKSSDVTVNAANPGTAVTSLWREIFPYNWQITWLLISPYSYLFWKSSSMAAETSYYCALDHDLVKASGKYFKDCKEETFPELQDEVGRKLWAVSERLLTPKKLSTLNQAAIKKALNEIAEAEAVKEQSEEEESADAGNIQPSERDVVAGAQADLEQDASKTSKTSVKKKKKISKKPNGVSKSESKTVASSKKSERREDEVGVSKSESKTVGSSKKSESKMEDGAANKPDEKNTLSVVDDSKSKEKRSPSPGKKAKESKDSKDGKGETTGSALRNRKPNNDKKDGSVTKTRKKAAK